MHDTLPTQWLFLIWTVNAALLYMCLLVCLYTDCMQYPEAGRDGSGSPRIISGL